MLLINPAALVFIAFSTVIGAIFNVTLIGLAIGLGFVFIASVLNG